MAVLEFTKENFDQEVGSGVSVVDFWAPWCGPCRIVGPIMDELAEEMTDVKIGKVNIDDHQELAVKYNVMSIPTIIVFKDGHPVNSSVGVASKKSLIDKINEAK